jgi:hypothetical protein
MDAITLRKLPPRVAGAVRKRAEERQTSLNKAVIGLLEESVGEPSGPRAHHDLDALCGVWSRAESRAFDRSLREQRAVDPELWK